MTEPLLSIIIPVHNLVTSGLLNDTSLLWLDSVPYEPRKDVQILVVNDASSDSSGEYLVARASAGGHVECVSLSVRVGPGAARNAGLEYARGTFVFFADADDQIDLDVLVEACLHASRRQLDVVALGYEVWADSGARSRSTPTEQDSLGSLLKRRAAIWRFLFRRSFLLRHQITFPPLQYAEDILFMLKVASSHPRLGALPRLAYRYHLHDRGLSGPPPNPRDARQALDELAHLRRAATLHDVRSLSDLWRLKISRRIPGSLRPADLPDLLSAASRAMMSSLLLSPGSPRCSDSFRRWKS